MHDIDRLLVPRLERPCHTESSTPLPSDTVAARGEATYEARGREEADGALPLTGATGLGLRAWTSRLIVGIVLPVGMSPAGELGR